MPFGDYDHGQIMSDVQNRVASGDTVRHHIQKHEQKIETMQEQHKLMQAKLKVHEHRQKRQQEGLKKAQAARKGSGKSGKRS